jgi:hypothetical protein
MLQHRQNCEHDLPGPSMSFLFIIRVKQYFAFAQPEPKVEFVVMLCAEWSSDPNNMVLPANVVPYHLVRTSADDAACFV